MTKWHCKRTKKKKKDREAATKDAKKLTKRAGKSAATQGETNEISARKALKILKMPPTEYRKILRKYKFRIYYRIY